MYNGIINQLITGGPHIAPSRHLARPKVIVFPASMGAEAAVQAGREAFPEVFSEILVSD